MLNLTGGIEPEAIARTKNAPAEAMTRISEAKAGKNRLHLDFRPDDRDAEVARLLDLGATRADIGQGDQTWVVLRDPEGNEFCVLSSGPEGATSA